MTETKPKRHSRLKARCEELERELAQLKAKVPSDEGDITLNFCLRGAGALLQAAWFIVESRSPVDQAPSPPPATVAPDGQDWPTWTNISLQDLDELLDSLRDSIVRALYTSGLESIEQRDVRREFRRAVTRWAEQGRPKDQSQDSGGESQGGGTDGK